MNYGSPNYSNSIFTADLDKDGTIYSIGTGRERVKVGIDMEKEQELLQTISEMQIPLENYFQKLIEIRKYLIEVYDDKDMVSQLSAFAPQKSPEEIAKEAANEQIRVVQETAAAQLRLAQEQAAQQAKVNQELLQAIQGLKYELGELKTNGTSRYADELSNEQVGNDSKSSLDTKKANKGGRGKSGSSAGPKDAP